MIFLIIFSLADLIVRMQYMIHITYKIYINKLYVIQNSFWSKNWLFVNFGVGSKVIYGFSTMWGVASLATTRFKKGQLL